MMRAGPGCSVRPRMTAGAPSGAAVRCDESVAGCTGESVRRGITSTGGAFSPLMCSGSVQSGPERARSHDCVPGCMSQNA